MVRKWGQRTLGEAVGLTIETTPNHDRPGGLWLGVLGPLEVTVDQRPVDVGRLKARCVLGLLAMQPGTKVSHEEVIDTLWGDRPPYSCVNLVHTYVSRLRKVVEQAGPHSGVRIGTTRGHYQLVADEGHLDLVRFDTLATSALQARHRDPASALSLFEQALECWRAPVLADLPARLRQHPVAVAVSTRRLTAALGFADMALALNQGHQQAVEQLRPLAREEPLHEPLHARLMLALAGSGQQAAALLMFADLCARLDEELGIRPGAELESAYLRILRQTSPAAGGWRPGPPGQASPAADRCHRVHRTGGRPRPARHPATQRRRHQHRRGDLGNRRDCGRR